MGMKRIDEQSVESFRRLLDRDLIRRGLDPNCPPSRRSEVGVERVVEVMVELQDIENQLLSMRAAGVRPSWELSTDTLREVRTRVLELLRVGTGRWR